MGLTFIQSFIICHVIPSTPLSDIPLSNFSTFLWYQIKKRNSLIIFHLRHFL